MLRKHNGWIWLWLSLLIVILDQLSKLFVVNHLVPGQNVQLLPFFNLHLAFNTGIAFGFLGGESGWQVPFFAVLTIAIIAVLFIWLGRIKRNDYLLSISLSLIIGGACGNLIDRLRLAYVVDFFDFHLGAWHFATFNLGDAAITVGAVLLFIKLFTSK